SQAGSRCSVDRRPGMSPTAGVPAGEPGRHATEVSPGVAAGYHQHFFTARLDMDVDGEANTAYEGEAVCLPAGPDNDDGTAFVSHRTTFTRESEARREISPLTARRWRGENPRPTKPSGQPV